MLSPMSQESVIATSIPQLSIVVPTYNERENVPVLIGKLEQALTGLQWEVIFVDDDSKDGTAEMVRTIASKNPRVRGLQRIGRRGLSGACIEGMLASSAPFIAVMDADCQHDETRLPVMLEMLTSNSAEIVVGSRFAAGGDIGDLGKLRLAGSKVSNAVAQRLLHVKLSDPMSGFFMIRRDQFMPLVHKLSSQGFKILLDIMATARGRLRVAEVPFTFGTRAHGESKMDTMVVMDFLGLLISKATSDLLPVRFFFFILVGGTGLVAHLLVLRLQLSVLHMAFAPAQTIAVFFAMTMNFFLNNQITYRSQRLKGFKKMLRGLLGSYAVWSIGAVANVAVATWVFENLPIWWLAASLGAVMGSVWNYTTSTLFVWRAR